MTPIDGTRNSDDPNIPQVSDFELGVLLERARSAYARMRELELAQYGLTPEQAANLHALQSKGGSSTSHEIANTIIRQYHSTASIMVRMEKLGLVKKEKVPHSKKMIISITEKGTEKYAQVSRDSLRMIFEDLTPQEKQQFAKTLKKILNKGREMLGLDSTLPFLSGNHI